MNDPAEIQIMFDKPRCHARLREAGVAVAPSLGELKSYDELISRMEATRCRRVFVKLAHGSSASGAIALRTDGARMQAFTTVEHDGTDVRGCRKLYNTRQIRRLDSAAEVAVIVNEICRHGAHVERWLPKAGIDGRVFDLRVVVIGGAACHVVPRLSRTPMTNLNLLNERGNVDGVRERCGATAWAAAMATCEQAADAFPNSLYAGIDLLLAPGFRRHHVLEVNAFGDLLPGVNWRGMGTYQAELQAMLEQPPMVEVA